jgi:predicted TPR repeat methyltransferase
LRIQLSSCHRQCGDTTDELETLEQCAADVLPIRCHMRMAQLYESVGKKKHAVISWLTVLKLNPRAIEAALALAKVTLSLSQEATFAWFHLFI